MEIIGLTGSIGMGKSLTASMLKALGIPVFDSDACVHSLLSGQAREQICHKFPVIWDKTSQTIDKKLLGEIIFADSKAKDELEAILHPMVWEAQQKFISKAKRAGKRRVILDIPLLFETGRHNICDKVICVTAPYFVEKQRVLSRKNMTFNKFKAILNSQMPDKDKQKLSDIVIPTGLGRRATITYLKKALKIGD